MRESLSWECGGKYYFQLRSAKADEGSLMAPASSSVLLMQQNLNASAKEPLQKSLPMLIASRNFRMQSWAFSHQMSRVYGIPYADLQDMGCPEPLPAQNDMKKTHCY